jgi:hypothetical protein
LVATHDIKIIILADQGITQNQQHSIAELCRLANTRFVLMPNIVDSLGDLCRGSSATGETGNQVGDSSELAVQSVWQGVALRR